MPNGIKSVLIVGIDETLRSKFLYTLGEGFDPTAIVLCPEIPNAVVYARTRNPSLIAIEWDAFLVSEITEFLQKLRSNPRFTMTPVIILSSASTGDIAPIAVEYDVAKTVRAQSQSPEFKRAVKQIAAELMRPDAYRTKLHQLGLEQDQKNWREADKIIESLYKEFPDSHRAKIEYANLCLRRGAVTDALLTARRALAFSPNNLRAMNTIARAHLLSGNYTEAVAILERSNAVSPGNVERLVSLGDGLLALERLKEAKEKYQQASKIDQKSETARQGLATIALSEDNFNNAVEILRDCQNQTELASLYNNIGIMAAKKGRFRTAESSYHAAIKALSQNDLKAKVHFNLGLRFERESNPSKATVEYKKALDLSPVFPKCKSRLNKISVISANNEDVKFFDVKEPQKTPAHQPPPSGIFDDDFQEIETIDPLPEDSGLRVETRDAVVKSFPLRVMLEKQKKPPGK
jgi:tetratricopeptide (TPR) repeat protein